MKIYQGACLAQAASQHGDDLQQWAKVARRMERSQLPRVRRWDRILKVLHEELRIEAEQLQHFLESSTKYDAAGAEGVSIPAPASMA